MKSSLFIKSIIVMLTLAINMSCVDEVADSLNQPQDEWSDFIKQDKFYPSDEFVGFKDEEIREKFEELINEAAEGFRKVSKSSYPTDEMYLAEIDLGLERINHCKQHLGTVEKEIIGFYFQDLMKICGLESSEGKLNTFLYGFDPVQFIDSIKNDTSKQVG